MKSIEARFLINRKNNNIIVLQKNIEEYQKEIKEVQNRCDHDCKHTNKNEYVGFGCMKYYDDYFIVTTCTDCGKEINKTLQRVISY